MKRPIGDNAVRERRRFLHRTAAGLAALSMGSLCRPAMAARADVLHLLCSGPAGSIPDLVARVVGEQISPSAAQRIFVDNRPGAAGQLSVMALKAAPVDGSTLLLAQGAIATVYPSLYSRLAYVPALDLKPVSLASEMVLGLAVGPAVPSEITTLAGFITWLREHPADANIGSPGTGTLPHLLEAMLFGAAGVPWQHVAYAGGPPAVNDLLGGRIAALALPEGLLRQHHATRRLRVLATSGPTRSSHLPDVPCFAEQGHPDLVVTEWFGFFAPGGAARGLVEELSSTLQAAIAHPKVLAAFAQAGMTPASSSPAAMATRITIEQRYWPPVLQRYGIRAD